MVPAGNVDGYDATIVRRFKNRFEVLLVDDLADTRGLFPNQADICLRAHNAEIIYRTPRDSTNRLFEPYAIFESVPTRPALLFPGESP